MDYSTPGSPVFHCLPEFAQIHVRWLMIPSHHLILCHPLLLLPSTFPRIRIFSNESAPHIRWPKNRSFSFSISPSNEYLGLISFRIGWFVLCCPRDSQESSPIPQFESINSWCSPFFMVQLSHSFMTTLGRVVFNWIMWLVVLSSPGPSPCLSTLLPVRHVFNLFFLFFGYFITNIKYLTLQNC